MIGGYEENDSDSGDSPYLQSLRLRKMNTRHFTERQRYLLKRFQLIGRTAGRLRKVLNDIKLYGGSRNHYAQNYAWKEIYEVEETPSKCPILPNSKFQKIWSIVIIGLLAYTATIMPYRMSFEDDTSMEWFVVDILIDCLFFVDIIVNFNLAFKDDETMELVTDRKKIIKRYLKFWFYIDLLACIPFQLISEDDDEDTSYNKLLRLIRLQRLYRVLRIFRLLKLLRLRRSQGYINKLVNKLRMTPGIIRLFNFGVLVVLMVHIGGCVWYYIARLEDFNYESWVFRHGLLDKSTGEIYLAAIYWVIQTLTTVGFGDILAVTPSERIYALLLMGIGVGIYSYTISSLSTTMTTMDTRSSTHKNKISALNEFCKHTKLDKELKKSIRKHIDYNNDENIYSWFDKDAFLKELPASLCREISLHLHKNIVDKISFFRDQDPQFISSIAPKLKRVTIPIGDIVYKDNDHASEVYFIVKGEINLKTSKGIVFKTYHKQKYFGEIEVLKNKPRKGTAIVASKKAKLLVLGKRDFMAVLDEFPTVKRELREKANIREENNERALDIALQEPDTSKLKEISSEIKISINPPEKDKGTQEKEERDAFLQKVIENNKAIQPEPEFTRTPTVSSIIFSASQTALRSEGLPIKQNLPEEFEAEVESPLITNENSLDDEETAYDLKGLLEELNVNEQRSENVMLATKQILNNIEAAHSEMNEKILEIINRLKK